MSGPLFGIVPAGLPLITEPTSTPSQTSFLYALPTSKNFSHIVVFLLPNVVLPENTAAAIYLATAGEVAGASQSGATPNFRFLGGIGSGKESAMFKVGGSPASSASDAGGLVIGVSVEPSEAVGQRLQELAAGKASSAAQSASQPSTVVLAQRIIQNAFNFLTSFSGTAGPGGVEVVPLRAFEDWWRKFESRVRTDPSFLEKQSD
ncbi:GCN5-related N-acetyltransferase (GNAT) domain-containingprotein [Purpureocillium lavendulum]|uniref:GCN5-related N-acetyltransferase (GNAT) domain-containingprotein n=1 Tax=Purpureocillium lavendulum TaxID=1247861 RepID=A0AB34FW58_9HYPO|nr:GCN5-related N-acetyltransferase (GNAT) domain-containingprotein [Purpureocillium lavendulum]